jgi:hypothetical protein
MRRRGELRPQRRVWRQTRKDNSKELTKKHFLSILCVPSSLLGHVFAN